MRWRVLIFLLLASRQLPAQLQEGFRDGDFTQNPPWNGNSSDWLVNANGQLQSKGTVANSTFYLSTPQQLATAVQWEFYVRLQFNPSGANYVDVYLVADSADLLSPSLAGYFVRIGNTQDDVSLYRRDATGTTTLLIDGIDGITNTSDNSLRIRVVRNAAHQFTLFRNASGGGLSYISEGQATDASYTATSFFGVVARQSTASFFGRHFLDDIHAAPYVPDTTPPQVLSVTAVAPHTLEVLFSEPVAAGGSEQVANYSVSNGAGNPLQAQRSAQNPSLVSLLLGTPFPSGVVHTISIQQVNDQWGNAMLPAALPFEYYRPQRYDVVIHEIMADPSPPVGLPASEYIELKNRSSHVLSLRGFRLWTAAGASAPFPDVLLPPDSLLILCNPGATTAFQPYGRVAGISGFPALPNEAGLLWITSAEGSTLHAVAYAPGWYGSTLKQEGGWSLEMKDAHNPCTREDNWQASTAALGGTPGRANAAAIVNKDDYPPRLIRTYTEDSLTLVAVFDEPLDSVEAAAAGRYVLESGPVVLSATPRSPLFGEVALKLSAPLQPGRIYLLKVRDVLDCCGQVVAAFHTARAGLSEEALPGDVVIDEILFNPRPGAFDYVELYNRSSRVVNTATLLLANRNGSNALAGFKKLSELPFALFPGDHIVISEDKASLLKEYFVPSPPLVLTVVGLPSYPNDKGNVALVNGQGTVLDEVPYEDGWHFPLLHNREGISLERIGASRPSADKSNWHSAAASAGYGTPAAINSQSRATVPGWAFSIQPNVFSPDNNGQDDFCFMLLTPPAAGSVANIQVFTAGGRSVRHLAKGATLGRQVSFKWDGLDEKLRPLPSGIYVVLAEVFNLDGERQVFKETVVIAR